MHTVEGFFHPFHTFFPPSSPGHLLPCLASTAERTCTLVSTFEYQEFAVSKCQKLLILLVISGRKVWQ